MVTCFVNVNLRHQPSVVLDPPIPLAPLGVACKREAKLSEYHVYPTSVVFWPPVGDAGGGKWGGARVFPKGVSRVGGFEVLVPGSLPRLEHTPICEGRRR